MQTFRILYILALILALGFAQTAAAEPAEPNAETKTESKGAQAEPFEPDVIILDRVMVIGDPEKIDEIPGSAYYIDKARLDKQGYNDILRILREVPGVNIQEEDGYGLRPNIGMRGTSVERSEKITVMEDGILIAPAPYAAPAAYYFPTAGRMQGVEVRKGSSQIKHGPYTTGGALNLVSTAIPYSFGGRAGVTLGENGARNLHAYVGDAYKNFGWLIESYQANADGYKNLDGGGHTGFDKKDYLAKFRVNTSRDARLYQELLFKVGQADETSSETYLGLTDADFVRTPYRRYAASQRDVMDTEQEQFQVRYFVQPGETFDLTATFYRNNFQRNWYKLDRVRASAGGARARIAAVLADPDAHAAEYAVLTGETSPNDDALEVKANNREYYAQGAQAVLGLRRDYGRLEHNIELGLRLHKDQIDRFQWVDKYRMDAGVMKLTEAGVKGTESNRVETATAFAAFAQYKLTYGRLQTTPGLRYENIRIKREDYGKTDPARTGADLKSRENRVDVAIPGLGLDYKLTPETNLFLGVHKGFAPPGSKAGTRPEESVNYELGLRYRKDALFAQAVVYYNDYSNLLGSDLAAAGGAGSGDLFNGGEAVARGLELDLHYDFGKAAGQPFSVPVRIAYTYTGAEFRSNFESDLEPWGAVRSGDELPYIPKHQLFLNLGVEHGRWGLDLSGKYSGRMRTSAGSGPVSEMQSTDAHFVLDATAEVALDGRARLFAGVRNLTDRVYIAARRPAGVRPGLPRTWISGIKADF